MKPPPIFTPPSRGKRTYKWKIDRNKVERMWNEDLMTYQEIADALRVSRVGVRVVVKQLEAQGVPMRSAEAVKQQIVRKMVPHGLGYRQVSRVARTLGVSDVTVKNAFKGTTPPNRSSPVHHRNRAMATLRGHGYTLQEIGIFFGGLSRERVRQLMEIYYEEARDACHDVHDCPVVEQAPAQPAGDGGPHPGGGESPGPDGG